MYVATTRGVHLKDTGGNGHWLYNIYDVLAVHGKEAMLFKGADMRSFRIEYASIPFDQIVPPPTALDELAALDQEFGIS